MQVDNSRILPNNKTFSGFRVFLLKHLSMSALLLLPQTVRRCNVFSKPRVFEMSEIKNRKHIPRDVTRELLIECGLKCSVPQCPIQWPTLQRHHIDENPSNNDNANLLLLCPTHHQMVTSGNIDRKTCEMLKGLIGTISKVGSTPETTIRNRLLYSLISELHANLMLFADLSFFDLDNYRVYPRFRHIVLDEVLISGAFIYDQDKELYTLLYDWATSLDDINRRLDLSELRDFGRLSENKIKEIRSKIVRSSAFTGCRDLCRRVLILLTDQYGQEAGLSRDSILFGKSIQETIGWS